MEKKKGICGSIALIIVGTVITTLVLSDIYCKYISSHEE